MPADVYIKFGESDDQGPDGTPLPSIEGDSTDLWHYWWCELRDCGFDLQASDWQTEGDAAANDHENATAKFPKVTLKKRVDWASTQLFTLCCNQAMALLKSKEEQEAGWIDRVTVEVCRQTGAMVKLGSETVLEKIPFVTVEYYDVRVTHYAVEMSGPEPSESLTFEFQKLKYKYQRTSPETGLKMSEDGVTETSELPNAATGQSNSAGTIGAASTPAGVAALSGGLAASVSASAGVTSSGAMPPGLPEINPFSSG